MPIGTTLSGTHFAWAEMRFAYFRPYSFKQHLLSFVRARKKKNTITKNQFPESTLIMTSNTDCMLQFKKSSEGYRIQI